jgi:hypothetical protein
MAGGARSQLNAVFDAPFGEGRESKLMGRVGFVIGCFLVILALIFVIQVSGIVVEVAGRQDLTRASPEGMRFDLRTSAIHDLFFTTQAFVLLHLWLAWASISFIRSRGQVGRALKCLGGLGLATVLVGHAGALWLASRGTSVGLW